MEKELVYKNCEVCNEESWQVVGPIATTCSQCGTRRDDGADELFGKEDSNGI